MKYIKNIRRIAIFTFFSLLGVNSLGQELVRPVVTGAPFLQIVPDAISGGMGEVGVAGFGDPYSQFHNPAKYLFIEENSRGFGLSYIPRFLGYADDIFHGNISYFHQLNERSALSGAITYFSFGDIEIEEELGYEIIQQGTFVPNEFAFEGTYSLKTSEYFGMAVTGRYIRSDITDNRMNSTVQLNSGQAVAVDLSGYFISAPIGHQNKWTAGFNLKNVGSKIKYSNVEGFEYPLPTSLKLGGGYHVASGQNDYVSFHAEALKFLVPATDDQRNIPDDSSIAGIFNSFIDAPDGFSEEMKEVIYSFGSEINLQNIFSIRAGYITQHRDKGMRNHITVGAGIAWEDFKFDFAYQSPIVDYISFEQDKVLKISLNYQFGK